MVGLAQLYRLPGDLDQAEAEYRAAGDLAGARAGAVELASLASFALSPVLSAMAAHAAGCVLAAEGDAAGGLSELRVAARAWQALRMPYDAARTA